MDHTSEEPRRRRYCYLKGRRRSQKFVEATYPDADGYVRKVKVAVADQSQQSSASHYERPIHGLIVLMSCREQKDRGFPAKEPWRKLELPLSSRSVRDNDWTLTFEHLIKLVSDFFVSFVLLSSLILCKLFYNLGEPCNCLTSNSY